MCTHAVIIYYFVKLCNSLTLQTMMSKETVKECLSHWYVMKLHRHTSHQNDEMRTHKWPQFVPDDVEHDDIYVMNWFICICCRNSLRQKYQRCLTRHVQMVCSYMTSHRIYRTYCHRREGLFSMNPIHNNTNYERIWWPLQIRWSTCQCSSNTRSNYRHIVLHA